MHSLLMGLHTTFREKLIWLEEAEDLTIAMRAARKKQQASSASNTDPE